MSIQQPTVWTADRQADLAGLLADGLSMSQAAKRLNLPRGSVCWAKARYGIGRAPADLSCATGRRPEDWTAERLTERWADRKRKAA